MFMNQPLHFKLFLVFYSPNNYLSISSSGCPEIIVHYLAVTETGEVIAEENESLYECDTEEEFLDKVSKLK